VSIKPAAAHYEQMKTMSGFGSGPGGKFDIADLGAERLRQRVMAVVKSALL